MDLLIKGTFPYVVDNVHSSRVIHPESSYLKNFLRSQSSVRYRADWSVPLPAIIHFINMTVSLSTSLVHLRAISL